MKLKKRKWLNPVDSYNHGWISYEITSGPDHYDCGGRIMFADCSRTISLNLDFSSEKDAKETADKIDILISSLQEIKEVIGEEYEKYIDSIVNGDVDEIFL